MSKVKTKITIKSDDTIGLCRLFDLIFDWVKKMHPDSDINDINVGRYYLQSIALHSDAISDVDGIGTLGYITSWTYSPKRPKVEIQQTTFSWQLCVSMWELIAQKYVSNATVSYKSSCESSGDFITNCSEYVDLFVVKTKEKTIENSSKSEVEKILSKRYKGSFNEMYSSFINKRPSCLDISKWDIVPISETV